MQLGSLELQIFVALFLVLGSAFVALVCDFLKGNNEQLRERNIELRVRQDERERLGLFEPLAHPITWLQGLAQLVRNPVVAEAAAGAAPAPPAGHAEGEPDLDNLTGAASPANDDSADRNPQRRHRYDEFKAAAKQQSWATKEELEQLAGRAARIRARHEASHRRPEEIVMAPPGRAALERAEPTPLPRIAEASKSLGATPISMPAPVTVRSRDEVRPDVVETRPEAPVVARVEVKTPAVAGTPAVAETPVVVETPVLTETLASVEAPVVVEVQASAPAESETVVTGIAGPIATAETEESPLAAQTEPAKALSEPAPAVTEATRVAEAEPAVTAAAEPEPPTMSQSHASTAWTFTPGAGSPVEPGGSTAAPVYRPQVIRPEAPAMVSALPSVPDERAPEENLAATAETLPEPPVLADASEPMIDIWRRPLAEESVLLADKPELIAEAAEVPTPSRIEPHKTRIQPVEIPPVSEFDPGEAETGDITPPVLQSAAPGIPAVRLPEVALPPQAPVVPAQSLDVAALQKATGQSQPVVVPEPIEISDGAADGKLDIPAGLHEASVLSGLLENQAPYSGVVVAIGLNDYDTLREKLASGADSVAALNKMVLSMLRPQDFACRFQDDEYILIYPSERGSSAQRRLFQVSEKLWDFQLRSLGNLSVMFSWGGLEVTNETLAEAVASARERMYQTKRNRKPSGLEFAGAGRKKVAKG